MIQIWLIKYKKILIGFAIFLVGCIIMDIIIMEISSTSPEMLNMSVDSVYASPTAKRLLGDLRNASFIVDSISADKTRYYFTGTIQGARKDTTVTGKAIKNGEGWKLVELRGYPLTKITN